MCVLVSSMEFKCRRHLLLGKTPLLVREYPSTGQGIPLYWSGNRWSSCHKPAGAAHGEVGSQAPWWQSHCHWWILDLSVDSYIYPEVYPPFIPF